jgi:hypothetical protein
MAADEHNTTVWVGIASTLVVVAVALTAIHGVIVAIHPGSEINFTSGFMIAAYAGFAVGAVVFLGSILRWKWLVGPSRSDFRGPGTEEATAPPPAPPVPVAEGRPSTSEFTRVPSGFERRA